MSNQFDKFSLDAKRAFISAQRAARQLGSQIKTDHFLLGIVATEDTLASEIMRENGVSNDKINLVLSLSRFIEVGGGSGISDEAKKVMERAMEIARKLGSTEVTCEHLLLAIVGSSESSGFRMLIEIGADITRIKQQLENSLSDGEIQHQEEETIEPPQVQGLSFGGSLPFFGSPEALNNLAAGVMAPPDKQKTLDAFTIDITKKAAVKIV